MTRKYPVSKTDIVLIGNCFMCMYSGRVGIAYGDYPCRGKYHFDLLSKGCGEVAGTNKKPKGTILTQGAQRFTQKTHRVILQSYENGSVNRF